MENLEALFAAWDAPMVQACLEGTMGRVVTWGEGALAAIGDFCFLAGRAVPELVEQADAPILVPGDENWSRLIEKYLGKGAVPFTRYTTQRRPEFFNQDRLFHFTTLLPEGFQMLPISKGLYLAMMAQDWSRDLCGNLADASDFASRGIGSAVLWEGRPVAGAASYAVCNGAIEIEIDTAPDFRQNGLATACGAKLILDCLDRGLYPGWDAHDSRSLALAEKLGYQMERPYTAYWVEEKARKRE